MPTKELQRYSSYYNNSNNIICYITRVKVHLHLHIYPRTVLYCLQPTSTKHLVLTFNSIFMIRSTAINLVLSCNETIKESFKWSTWYTRTDIQIYLCTATILHIPVTINHSLPHIVASIRKLLLSKSSPFSPQFSNSSLQIKHLHENLLS